MPTYQYWDEDNVGTYVQNNYEFMDQLFGVKGDHLRKILWDAANDSEGALRDLMNAKLPHLKIPNTVRVGLADLQAPRYKDFGINAGDTYYIMVLPPNPQRQPQSTQQTYIDDQEWENAFYHATVDGYGM
jgi:hypothetical protein